MSIIDSDSDCEYVTCEVCNDEFTSDRIMGCCNNEEGCPFNIENLCQDCGTWVDADEAWYCDGCAKDIDVVECDGCDETMDMKKATVLPTGKFCCNCEPKKECE
jgi:hypothetical protein